eukprot:1637091-Prorocentrum_lima.AAC.1
MAAEVKQRPISVGDKVRVRPGGALLSQGNKDHQAMDMVQMTASGIPHLTDEAGCLRDQRH